MALLLRRGTDAERQTIIPAQGELIYTTDTKELYVGDGATQGGILVSAELVDDTSPSLGGDLDLNGNNITGTGNINITGTITATGNINLGDGVEDNVIVGGQIGSSLIPGSTDSYNLGDSLAVWNEIHATSIFAEGGDFNGEVSVGRLVTDGDIIKTDSSTLYDSVSDTITAANFIGDLSGSVFADDSSSVLVDAVNSELSNGVLRLSGSEIRVDGIADEITLVTPFTQVKHFGVSNDLNDMGFVSLGAARGTEDLPEPVEVGDVLGSFAISDQVSSKILLSATIDQVSGTNPLPGKMLLSVHDYDGGFTPFASLNARGTFEAPTFKATPYANSGARDTAIPSPEAGMVIFNQNDDSTGKPQLQCYDGTSWIELH